MSHSSPVQRFSLRGLLLALLLGTAPLAGAGNYVHVPVAGGAELYYESVGQGRPVVIVPGWTMTTRYFTRQLEHYADSEQVRLIVYDPRAHGHSSKTLEGADYARHARDLRQFIEALELKDVVLAGWSWGGITVYAYLDAFGTDNVSAAVLIDQTPTPLATGDSPWVDGDRAAVKGFFDAFVSNRRATVGEFIPWMYTEEIAPAEAEWMLAETMLTPTIVASQLLYDGWMGDWTATVQAIDVPMLHVVREENGSAARDYLEQHAPEAEIAVMGGHGMVPEHAEDFNRTLDEFLASLES